MTFHEIEAIKNKTRNIPIDGETMSATLIYTIPANNKSLPSALRVALQKRWDYPRSVDNSDIPYLEGLADAQVEGAKELIALIEKHGRVELSLVY